MGEEIPPEKPTQPMECTACCNYVAGHVHVYFTQPSYGLCEGTIFNAPEGGCYYEGYIYCPDVGYSLNVVVSFCVSGQDAACTAYTAGGTPFCHCIGYGAQCIGFGCNSAPSCHWVVTG